MLPDLLRQVDPDQDIATVTADGMRHQALLPYAGAPAHKLP
ncbi:hypothetical protein SSE37_01250 [Sagittula stellata E-37]|uniref:Uncharacterized protein n=1 Tax=Sagittula stellata (strain ATCC 700073 / DSM 11524 / E-37) TaxID=388399 RepID=A3K4D8_SAGS3|nr:hypothetical protein SSE37_01250 [Sagittula stellata E-37]